MSRVKRGVIKNKRRKNILGQVKGYRFGRSTKEAAAKEAINHAGSYAFAHRRDKKNDMRQLAQIRIGATVKSMGMSYSKFMGAMKAKNILLDRKTLSELARKHPETFNRVFKTVQ